ncbi:MAG: hypothetical protein Harvfovirus56_6 [Harvfovirus sp.]|uniref:Leucine-rich repeat protein n=1 Tax=Harvfovirus sp. TaxID=2487768 RepID=A0A3G5A8N6_9VIRU|nr:MAG: hypothetical protein Harvfovirus56_6 [Harvfovirus sp.]
MSAFLGWGAIFGGVGLGYVINKEIKKRARIGRLDILNFTPFSILSEYLNCDDLIELAKINRYFKKEVFNKAKTVCEIYDVQDQADLMGIFKDVKMSMKLNSKIKNDEIKMLVNVVSLDTRECTWIRDDGLEHLTNLRSLRFGHWNQISDFTVFRLTQLTSLSFSNEIITDDGLDNLTFLKALKFNNNENRITDRGLMKLVNLVSLNMKFGLISDQALMCLTKLTSLRIYLNDRITDRGVGMLRGLKVLSVGARIFTPPMLNVTDAGIIGLNLTELDISNNKCITDAAVGTFRNLTSLNIQSNNKITDDAVSVLTNLRSLNLGLNNLISNDAVKCLVNLTSLNLFGNRRISSLKGLVKLQRLNLEFNDMIWGRDLMSVLNLTDLNLNSTSFNVESYLKCLTKLCSLNVRNYKSIEDATLGKLTNLTRLTCRGNCLLTKAAILRLPKLKVLCLASHAKFEEAYSVRKLRGRKDDVIPTWESEHPVK